MSPYFRHKIRLYCREDLTNVLVIVLLFLFSPVLVELVDFHSSVSLLNQVKGLQNIRQIYIVMETLVLFCVPKYDKYFIYLVNFTKASSSKKVEEQISFVQCWVVFKSLDAGEQK